MSRHASNDPEHEGEDTFEAREDPGFDPDLEDEEGDTE